MQALTRGGMVEGQFGGMQTEPVGFLSVEVVAHNGQTQSFGMSTVHA